MPVPYRMRCAGRRSTAGPGAGSRLTVCVSEALDGSATSVGTRPPRATDCSSDVQRGRDQSDAQFPDRPCQGPPLRCQSADVSFPSPHTDLEDQEN